MSETQTANFMPKKTRRFLKYNKTYCFPNKFGLLGFALFVVILAAGATYQNNLIFMMGFICLSFGMVAILQTARNLQNISVIALHVHGDYVGERSEAELTVKNNTDQTKLGLDLRLDWSGSPLHFTIPELSPYSAVTVRGSCMLDQSRGVHKVTRARLVTDFPYGLFRAWFYADCNDEIFIYPKAHGQELFHKAYSQAGEDFSGLKSYETGDNPRRIDWKVFSKTRDLYVKEFKEADGTEYVLSWDDLASEDFESRLSQMSAWILQAKNASARYNVILPKFQSGVGEGPYHFHKCMKALTRMAR